MPRSFSSLVLTLAILALFTREGHCEDADDCKTRINYHRQKYRVTPLVEEQEDLKSCVDRQSEFD